MSTDQLPDAIQDKVYRPSEHEVYDVKLERGQIFNAGEVQVVDDEEIE